ncbi:MAG: exodeoxyribonuclease V subunit gamma [Pseudomonadota bacterium]
MLRVYHGNRLEDLAQALMAVMSSAPLSSALAKEVVVTQHQGMARWLALQIAQSRGVAANLDFPFPAAFIWQLYHRHLDEVPERSGYDREILTWRIMAALPAHLESAPFQALKHYLTTGAAALKLYQLARRIADTYEQYLIYRPDWVLDWEADKNTGCAGHLWQPILWRALTRGQAPRHRARLYHEFCALAAQDRLNAKRLPERVMVFGVSTLPPAYLDVLAGIARQIDVHVFTLNPSLGYWDEIEDEKTLARLRQRWQRLGKEDISAYYHTGNSLLASMGKQGRDFQRLLHQGEFQAEDIDCFSVPGEETLLQCLQGDILQLQERGMDAPVLALAPADRSVQIHSCHSPMREVQVLHDQLLDLFQRRPGLQPREIVVLTPEIDTYAPYIEAVFGTAAEGRKIPWSIADRSAQAEHPILQTFLQLFRLPSARMTASEVLGILEVPAVYRHYGLDETALERIKQWVQESGIRWGLDAQARAELGQPCGEAFTWAFGLRRMMLGFAMPPEEIRFGEQVPYIHIEGLEFQWVGKLHAFLDDLGVLRAQLHRPHTAERWQEIINAMLARFEATDEDEITALQLARDAAHRLFEHAVQAGYDQPIALEVVRDYLKGHLIMPAGPHRFLSGQVTFCAMMPMRSIPFRVVCMIGMHDKSYPRTRPPLGFDLMADAPRPGDRSRRDDDRYLFLEALLSARETLYISYVGRSIRDNALMLPSVLVSELLDYIEQGYALSDGNLRAQLITEHPLQPFSPRYFTDQPGLFSYAEEWAGGSQSLLGPAVTPRFIEAPLPEPEAEYRNVALDDLIAFFQNPAKYFLRQRLGIVLRQAQEAGEDVEPFALDKLDQYQLKQSILQQAISGADLDEYFEILRGKGELPLGAFAEAEYQSHVAAARPLAQKINAQLAAGLETGELDLALGEFRLHGWLKNITVHGQVQYRFTKIKAKDRLRLWLAHLALNAIRPGARSRHFGEDEEFVLAPVERAAQLLHRLLEIYWRGLSSALPFYPETSLAYARQQLAGDRAKGLEQAIRAWEGNDFAPGEGADPYLAMAMRGRHPLEETFAELAVAVYQPMLTAEEAR